MQYGLCKLRFVFIFICLLLYGLENIQAQEKEWLGILITQATLNEKDITSEYEGHKCLRLFKDNNGIVQLWILDRDKNYKIVSYGKIDLINHQIFQADIELDFYTATWNFNDFCGINKGEAQIELMLDRERNPKYPTSIPEEVKGFNVRIKTLDKELFLIGLYVISNANNLEDVLR